MHKNITKAKFYLSLFFVLLGLAYILFFKSDESKFIGIPSNKFMWGVIVLINIIPVLFYLKQEKDKSNL